MRKLLVAFCLLVSTVSFAQDFNCRVQVLHNQVSTTNLQIFKNMELSVTEFFNNRKWSSEKINVNERIDLTILINVSSFDNIDRFAGVLQIQASRPVFGTTYNTVLFNHEDLEFGFSYVNFQAMDFNENSYSNNFTSVMAYYAFMVLGLDGDSFSPEGGNNYFNKANNIMLSAQSSGEVGWNAPDGKNNRNRYWLIENVLNSRFKPMREAFYIYHRKGLDVMNKNVDAGRTEITNALRMIQKVAKVIPNSVYLKAFFNAKADELVNIYSKALSSDKQKVVEILNEIDPANRNRWEKILKS